MPAKIVGKREIYRAKVSVDLEVVAEVNPNGRMYDADNVTERYTNDVLDITVRADSPGALRSKLDAILSTIEDPERRPDRGA